MGVLIVQNYLLHNFSMTNLCTNFERNSRKTVGVHDIKLLEGEIIPKPEGGDTSKLCNAQLHHVTNICKNFQNNHSKTVVHDTKILKSDTYLR